MRLNLVCGNVFTIDGQPVVELFQMTSQMKYLLPSCSKQCYLQLDRFFALMGCTHSLVGNISHLSQSQAGIRVTHL